MIELRQLNPSEVKLEKPVIRTKIILSGPRLVRKVIDAELDLEVATIGQAINKIFENDRVATIQTYNEMETVALVRKTGEYHHLVSDPFNLSGRGYIDGKIHNVRDLLERKDLDKHTRSFLFVIGKENQVVEDRFGNFTKFGEGDFLINVTKNNDLVASGVV